MLNVGALKEGYVLDHIKAGKSMTIYHDLKLDKLDCTVAIIKNARSKKYGKKDIIKIEGNLDIDLEILGYIDPNPPAAPPVFRVRLEKNKNFKFISTPS